MGERAASTDTPTSEAVATTGLFLNIASVIALAICLAGLGASNAALGTAAGVAAALAFVGSLVCFGKQAEDREAPQPVSA
jgi:multisubunit Na+/H+ antiporter MnhB subunit